MVVTLMDQRVQTLCGLYLFLSSMETSNNCVGGMDS